MMRIACLGNSTEVKISTMDSKEDRKGHFIQKAKVGILLEFSVGFDPFFAYFSSS